MGKGFPLYIFPPLYSTTYSNLSFQISNVENLSPQIIRRVAKEMSELATQPPEGIRVILNEEDVTDIQAIIEGPCKIKPRIITTLLNARSINTYYLESFVITRS